MYVVLLKIYGERERSPQLKARCLRTMHGVATGMDLTAGQKGRIGRAHYSATQLRQLPSAWAASPWGGRIYSFAKTPHSQNPPPETTPPTHQAAQRTHTNAANTLTPPLIPFPSTPCPGSALVIHLDFFHHPSWRPQPPISERSSAPDAQSSQDPTAAQV